MTSYKDYLKVEREVGKLEAEELSQAHDHWGAAIGRYLFYRRRGYGIETSYDGALAWARNVQEQASRRKHHDTGCE